MKILKKNFSRTFIIFLINIASLHAEVIPNYFELASSAKIIAMGNSFVEEDTDISSLLLNPAAAFSQRQILLNYFKNSDFDFSNYSCILTPIKPRKINFSIIFSQSDISNIPYTQEDPITGKAKKIGEFSQNTTLIVINFAYSIKKIFLGTNIKYFKMNFFDYVADGFGCDLGLLTKLNTNLPIGISIHNPHFSVKDDKFPFFINLSCSYSILKPPICLSLIYVPFTEDKMLKNKVRFGVEYKYKILAFRIGKNQRDFISMGIGIEHKNFAIDFAYQLEDLISMNFVSLKVSF